MAILSLNDIAKDDTSYRARAAAFLGLAWRRRCLSASGPPLGLKSR